MAQWYDVWRRPQQSEFDPHAGCHLIQVKKLFNILFESLSVTTKFGCFASEQSSFTCKACMKYVCDFNVKIMNFVYMVV